MPANDNGFRKRYITTRKSTETICNPLEAEDLVVQPTLDVSPPKWHLAHTTWFFENFILKTMIPIIKNSIPGTITCLIVII